MTDYKGYSFLYHPKFKKEFNKIFKKHQCPTVKEDFKLLYDVLIEQLKTHDNFKDHHLCKSIQGLEDCVLFSPYIIKQFRCKGINKGSRSGFRITFLFDVEESRFIFIEMFMKSKKPTPDKQRINDLFKNKISIYTELYEGEYDLLNKKSS